jgi:uncharacterized SAM-binding protein YcdF (DUF218 family)
MGFSRDTEGEEKRGGHGPHAVGVGTIVVLGGRIRASSDGALLGAVGRRVRTAASIAGDAIVVASGGCVWDGRVEADAMADALVRLGVARERIVRERCSLSTRDNARFVASVLSRRGIDEATIVTCSWHLARAVALFRREGIRAIGHAADGEPRVGIAKRVWRWGRERVSMRLDGVA